MLQIEEQRSFLTRGDDANLQVALATGAGDAWTMDPEDRLVLTGRARPDAASPVLARIPGARGSDVLPIRSADTAGLPVGGYSADILLETASGGRSTVWPRLEGGARSVSRNYRNFVIMGEVSEQ